MVNWDPGESMTKVDVEINLAAGQEDPGTEADNRLR
jgi:hypothetical protein